MSSYPPKNWIYDRISFPTTLVKLVLLQPLRCDTLLIGSATISSRWSVWFISCVKRWTNHLFSQGRSSENAQLTREVDAAHVRFRRSFLDIKDDDTSQAEPAIPKLGDLDRHTLESESPRLQDAHENVRCSLPPMLALQDKPQNSVKCCLWATWWSEWEWHYKILVIYTFQKIYQNCLRIFRKKCLKFAKISAENRDLLL